MIFDILTILTFALAYTIKGGSLKHASPQYGEWKEAFRSKSWWHDRILDGKVFSTLIVFAYSLLLYSDYQGMEGAIPQFDLNVWPALGVAFAWLIAVAPSMGEENGAIGHMKGAWGFYIDSGAGREYGVKKAIQRGVFMGAAMAVATGDTTFILASLAYVPIVFIGQEINRRFNLGVGWALTEPAKGAIIFGVSFAYI
jgi:hypothetical protein